MAERFHRHEFRIVLATSVASALRAFGLNMALPVLATWAAGLPGATPWKIGLSVGAYGLTQGLLQVPFGILGDVLGRRFVITLSLLLFAAGAALIATASSIDMVIVGRLLQGSGALASTIIALMGDATRAELRARAMAVLGVGLGVSFAVGFLCGPLFAARYGVGAVFAMSCGLALLGVAVFELSIPSHALPYAWRRREPRSDRGWSGAEARALLRERSLLVLDVGVFSLHAALTGLFVGVPFLLQRHTANEGLWRVYAPVIALGLVAMIRAAKRAERADQMKPVLRFGCAALVGGLCGLALFQGSLAAITISLACFVVGFATLEPVMAALLTRSVRESARGTAAGIYAQAQFLGVFAGGASVGPLLDLSDRAPYLALAGLPTLWWFAIGWLKVPGSGAPPGRAATR